MATIKGIIDNGNFVEKAESGFAASMGDRFALADAGRVVSLRQASAEPAAPATTPHDGPVAPDAPLDWAMSARRIDGTNGDDILYEFTGEPGTVGHMGIQSEEELFGYDGDDTFVMRRDIGAGNNSSNTDIVHGGLGTDTIRAVFNDNRVDLDLTNDAAGGHAGTLIEIINGSTSTTPGGGGPPPEVPQFTSFDGLERFDIRFVNGFGQFNGAFGLTLGDGNDVARIERAGKATMNMGAGGDLVVLTTPLGWNADLRLDAGYDLLRFDSIGQDNNPSALNLSNTLSGTLAAGYSGTFTGNGRLDFAGVEDFDFATGSANDTVLVGDGDDRVATLGGNDRVTAGAGVNVLDGGVGTDLLSLSLASQTSGVTIDLRLSGVQQAGGAGSITGFEGFFGTIIGSAFSDTFYDGPTDENAVFNTGDGDDEVTLTGGTDTVNMGAGNDRLVLDFGDATNEVRVLSALTGNVAEGYSGGFYIVDNSARASFTGVENFTITSGSFADGFTTGDGNDVLSSGGGNDVIAAGGGTNVVDGGAGIDALSIDLSGQAQGVTIDLLGANAQQTGGTGSITAFESFAGSVKGSAFNDVLIEGVHNFAATFDTGVGNDRVQVARGSDTVNMGTGNDRLVIDYSTANNAVAVLAALTGTLADGYSGGFYIVDNAARTSFSGVENFTITSGAFNDAFTTGDGNDILSGGDGNDTMAAGGGTNTVDGGVGIDALGIDLSGQGAGVTIDLLRTGAQQTGGAGSVGGFESFAGSVKGSAFDDTLIEGVYNFAATFDTGVGNDRVQVARGNDTVNMGAGSDRLVLDYSTAANNVAVLAALTGTLADGYAGGFYIVDNAARTSFSGVENFTITSGAFVDTFTTGDGDDILSGGDGNDIIAAGGGTNIVDGGAGTDALAIDLSGQSQGLTIDLLRTGAQQTGGAGSVAGFESFSGAVVGSRFADTLIEGVHNFGATFDTGAGDDLVQVARGNDTANMGVGNDRLVLDYSSVNNAVAVLASLTGTLADGYSGGFYIVDNAARTSFTGVENFTITSGAFADTVTTGDGDDILSGGAANDTIRAGGGTNIVDGGAGIDALGIDLSRQTQGVTIDLLRTGAQQSGGTGSVAGFESFVGAVLGSRFADTLVEGAFAFATTFDTGAGNDRLQVSRGTDTANMGVGNDRLVLDYGTATSGVFALAALTGTVANGYSGGFYITDNAARTSFTGVENFTITSGLGADTLVTGDGADVLSGGAGNDTFTGAGGNDTLNGGAGDDRLNGGAGLDTASYSGATVGVTVSLGIAVAQATGEGSDTLTDIESLIGSGFADTLTGNDLANRLDGGAGNDRLNGGLGADRMFGGAGDDIYSVQATGDVVTELAGEGNDRVESRVTFRLGADVEALDLIGSNAIDGTGNVLANAITGNDAANRIEGGGGNDTLTGASGNDILVGGTGADAMAGGAGDDLYFVDAAGDTAIELAGRGYDEVRASVTYTLGAEVENLVLTAAGIDGTGNAIDNVITGGAGANTLLGLGGADTLDGGEANDTLDGGGANDELTGGVGRDFLTGGAGADRFVFRDGDSAATTGAADLIRDFSSAEGDRIVLDAIDANGAGAGDGAFAFIGTAAFGNVAGELRYQTIGADTFVMGDTDGNGAADFMIRMVGAVTLAATDFVL